jgi:hypothetical protein
MKIRQVGGRAVQYRWTADEQTDMTKLTVAFRNSVNAPKNRTTLRFCSLLAQSTINI